ncbi:cob(I)yrinic acid a,c-diamide adenosyltransferase [uncultured Gemmiger sp.]|uniref:cob(I)yrinic acid a,c-diamide adenosyltransferase n=1 Tax=uncultured Gemmiger sp. TaxID=1623490 RepID=UPI0025E7016F|nr:cob(I)yrinic acid a,c-diamide adenosyltransferase [uncultured Gemmiger sp.]
MSGLVHLYCGDGKGKTTAAMGLALRALGAGLRVTIVQFLKDGQSAELAPLRALGAAVYAGEPGMKFVFQMTEAEKAAARAEQNALLRAALAEPCDLLVLDEACAAAALGMVEEPLLKTAVLDRPAGREVCLTGRDPAPWLTAAADYITEMQCVRHPYDRGVPARRGIEF